MLTRAMLLLTIGRCIVSFSTVCLQQLTTHIFIRNGRRTSKTSWSYSNCCRQRTNQKRRTRWKSKCSTKQWKNYLCFVRYLIDFLVFIRTFVFIFCKAKMTVSRWFSRLEQLEKNWSTKVTRVHTSSRAAKLKKWLHTSSSMLTNTW